MKKIDVFSVDYSEDLVPNHIGLFFNEQVAERVSKGNGAYNQDAKVTPQTITIFDSVEEFVAETGKKVLSEEEIKERIIKKALPKLTPEERKMFGYD